jgi:predicted alpha/beta hydrolase family esterase
MIFIIHGTEGDGNENFFPWLRERLKGEKIITPKFPTPGGQTLEAWREVFDPYMEQVDDAILIGHSAGCAFILDILERTDKKARAAFLVAAFASLLGSRYDDVLETFVDRKFDWEKIRQSAGRIYVYNSDNDPYVPQEMGVEIAQRVGGNATIMHGAGHFNTREVPLLLEDIRNVK